LQFYHQNLRFSDEQRLTVGAQSREYPIIVRKIESGRHPNPDRSHARDGSSRSEAAGYREAILRGWTTARQRAEAEGADALPEQERELLEFLLAELPDPVATRLQEVAPHCRTLFCRRLLDLADERFQRGAVGPEAARVCLAVVSHLDPADSAAARVADLLIESWVLVSQAELRAGATSAAWLAAEVALHLLPLSTGDGDLYLAAIRARADAFEVAGDAEAAEARREVQELERELARTMEREEDDLAPHHQSSPPPREEIH
jgi:hypothetical protein